MTFVDTNILLYAISPVAAERPKALTARKILQRTDIALSVQVLQEFYVQATRPTRTQPLAHADATALIELWLRVSGGRALRAAPASRPALEGPLPDFLLGCRHPRGCHHRLL